jgi:hypothetical protein
MGIDLFGDNLQEKALTPVQRMTIRRAGAQGRDLYAAEPNDIDRFIKAIKRDGEELPDPIWEAAAGRGIYSD